jgi:hypothetical protein
VTAFLVNVARRGAGLAPLAASSLACTLAVPPGAPSFAPAPNRTRATFGERGRENTAAAVAAAVFSAIPSAPPETSFAPESVHRSQPGDVRWRSAPAARAEVAHDHAAPAPAPSPPAVLSEPGASAPPAVQALAHDTPLRARVVAPLAAPGPPEGIAPSARFAPEEAIAPRADDDVSPASSIAADVRSDVPLAAPVERGPARGEPAVVLHETVREHAIVRERDAVREQRPRTNVAVAVAAAHEERAPQSPAPRAATPAVRVREPQAADERPAAPPAAVPRPAAFRRVPAFGPERGARADTPRDVHVTIGTIELRSAAAAHAAPAPAREAAVAGFDAYAALRRYERLLP